MHYPNHRLSKFGQIESETVGGPLFKLSPWDQNRACCRGNMRLYNIFFQNMVMLHIKLKGMKHTLTSDFALHTPLIPGVGSDVCFFFFYESSHVAYQNGNKEENTMQAKILPFYTPTTPGRVKMSFFFFFIYCNTPSRGLRAGHFF